MAAPVTTDAIAKRVEREGDRHGLGERGIEEGRAGSTVRKDGTPQGGGTEEITSKHIKSLNRKAFAFPSPSYSTQNPIEHLVPLQNVRLCHLSH